MFDKFEWIASRYEELSEAIVQPEVIQDTAKYQAYLKERAGLEPQLDAWQRYQRLLDAVAQAEEMLADADLAGGLVVTTSAVSCITMFLWSFSLMELGLM